MDSVELERGQEAVHSEIEELSRKRDSEISYYFASVLNEVLRGIVMVEQSDEVSGKRLGQLVQGYEIALNEAVGCVETVLNQRRVSSQIAASRSKEPDRNGWDRKVSTEQILSFSRKSIGDQRQEVSKLVSKVDDISFMSEFAESATANNIEEVFKQWYRDLNFDQQNDFYCHAVGFITMKMVLTLIDATEDGRQEALAERLDTTTY